jgi:predicted Zn-dependent peptidase
MEKIHMQLRRNEVSQLSSTLSRATELGKMAVYFNDPDLVNSQTKTLTKVSKQQVQQAIKTYLTEANRTVVITVPKPKAAAASPEEN